MALLFGLTAAPASQPGSALVGQVVSVIIALWVAALPGLEICMKQTLATSVAIAAIVKLGIAHPPAAAVTMAFASSDTLGWLNLATLLLGNLLAILVATVINDLNSKRQHPTCWGVQWCCDFFLGFFPPKSADPALDSSNHKTKELPPKSKPAAAATVIVKKVLEKPPSPCENEESCLVEMEKPAKRHAGAIEEIEC